MRSSPQAEEPPRGSRRAPGKVMLQKSSNIQLQQASRISFFRLPNSTHTLFQAWILSFLTEEQVLGPPSITGENILGTRPRKGVTLPLPPRVAESGAPTGDQIYLTGEN